MAAETEPTTLVGRIEHTPVDPLEPAPQPTDNHVRKSDGVQDVDQEPHLVEIKR